MMGAVEKEDLEDLIEILKQAVASVEHLLDDSGRLDGLERCRQDLQSFHTTASMLGLSHLEQVGIALENYVRNDLTRTLPTGGDAIVPFLSAATTLADEMRRAASGEAGLAFDPQAIIEILQGGASGRAAGGEITELSAEEFPPSFLSTAAEMVREEVPVPVSESPQMETETLDFKRLSTIVQHLGGELCIEGLSGDAGTFQIAFPSLPANLARMETLLSPPDPDGVFDRFLTNQDARTVRVVSVMKEFMKAMSNGEVMTAQEILLDLADQQDPGLYNQIGSLARQLHDSLRNFVNLIDPALVDMVEDKLPDSGSRLEHILQLTEKAANTTLDHVEAMKDRNQEEQAKLGRLREIFSDLKAVGDKAQERLGETSQLLNDLQVSLAETSSDLITVLTAQDYQDLTGQVILKIIQLLKDLEKSLVNIIRTFGLKMDGRKQETTEELYGPAHMGKTEALHSQDDVDSLLADFGF